MRAALVALLLLASPAAAETGAAALFDAGDFAGAAAAGEAEKTAAGFTLAGRARSTQAAFETRDKATARALLLAAEKDFDAALALQPGRPDALLQKAIAIGYRAKLERSPGLAKQAKRNFEALLAARPKDALVLGTLGGWHGESVATLGRFIAGTVLGAKEAEAIRFYDRALAAPGADPVIPVFYATTLLALSADHGAKAKALLQRSLRTPAGDGFEALLQKNARAILVPLEKGDIVAARAVAAQLAPLGTVS